MDDLFLPLVLAVTVEALVQYVKSVGGMVVARDYKTAVTQMGALLAGVALCAAAGADIYAALGVSFTGPGADYLGTLLTGVFASRGANYVSDFLGRLRPSGAAGETDS